MVLCFISDVEILKSLPQRELVCGYAEILKHALILKGNFFYWLKNNSNKLLKKRNLDVLKEAIVQSCKIKLHFVNKDIFDVLIILGVSVFSPIANVSSVLTASKVLNLFVNNSTASSSIDIPLFLSKSPAILIVP